MCQFFSRFRGQCDWGPSIPTHRTPHPRPQVSQRPLAEIMSTTSKQIKKRQVSSRDLPALEPFANLRNLILTCTANHSTCMFYVDIGTDYSRESLDVRPKTKPGCTYLFYRRRWAHIFQMPCCPIYEREKLRSFFVQIAKRPCGIYFRFILYCERILVFHPKQQARRRQTGGFDGAQIEKRLTSHCCPALHFDLRKFVIMTKAIHTQLTYTMK